jgi:hypothetical protein
LLNIKGIESALLTAAGLSDKAPGHLKENDKSEAIANLIRNFPKPAGEKFAEELVFRFLLTRGIAPQHPGWYNMTCIWPESRPIGPFIAIPMGSSGATMGGGCVEKSEEALRVRGGMIFPGRF